MPEPSRHRPVAVMGAGSHLGGLVMTLLEESPEVGPVLALDALDGPSVAEHLAGVATVVHVDRQRGPDPDHVAWATERTRLVEAVTEAGVDHVVVVSSAAVYGAWTDNPVPLTEEAPLRPNPGAGYALEKVESERRWGSWAGEHDGVNLAVLRPALVVGDPDEQWLVMARRAAARWGLGDGETPLQLVHVDDVASAVVVAVERSLDGVYNVAPEGWLEGKEVQTLAGTPLHPPVPRPLAAAAGRWCWNRGLGGVCPELLPLAIHPWVVAADRLRAEGWKAVRSCGESLVEAYPVTTWARLGAKPRREVTLAAGSLVALGLPAGLLALGRSRHRRHR